MIIDIDFSQPKAACGLLYKKTTEDSTQDIKEVQFIGVPLTTVEKQAFLIRSLEFLSKGC